MTMTKPARSQMDPIPSVEIAIHEETTREPENACAEKMKTMRRKREGSGCAAMRELILKLLSMKRDPLYHDLLVSWAISTSQSTTIPNCSIRHSHTIRPTMSVNACG